MMDTPDLDSRVLVFMPSGRDAPASAAFINHVGLPTLVCPTLADLAREAPLGAAAVLLAEEGLFGEDISLVTRGVADQPTWSDLPFVVLTTRQDGPAISRWRKKLIAELRNVSLLERPVQTITLTSTIRAAVRARQRQYEVRALLDAQARAARELERQVQERTADLAHANAELREQMAERSRMEEVLRQAQKIEAIGQLTGGVAHDFNNLLMVISGGLEMLERQRDPVCRRQLLKGMHRAAERGSGLTRQLLAFSRSTPLNPEPVDLQLQIGGMRDLLERSLRGDIHVALSFAEGLWPVTVDPGELELVVLNLAVNARDAMPSGGTIEIRAENFAEYAKGDLVGDYVCLSVSDNGTGMTEEVKAHVFEPFYTTKEVGRGSGLGLAQVYGFAVQSEGAVQIESELDRGTTIAILLPRSLVSPARNERPLVNSDVGSPCDQAGSVLLVEDDDEVAALVTEMLQQLGYQVTRTASAVAALGALANNRSIDLVFSDIMMPGGMSGVELAREIRRRRRDLPILLTSAYVEAARDSMRTEGVQVLPKPYRLDQLAAALETAISAC